MPDNERIFRYRDHVKGCLHFFILLVCSAMVAATLFPCIVVSDAGLLPLLPVFVSLAASALAGGLAWRAASIVTGQRVLLREDGVEQHIGRVVKFVPLEAVTCVTLITVPLVGGRARLWTRGLSLNLNTNLRGIVSLMQEIRRRLDDAGRRHTYDFGELDAFLETAAFCEERADRYTHRYGAFPWLAVLAPLVVVAAGRFIPVPEGTRLVWAGLSALYPWVVIFILEAVFARQFLERQAASGREPVGPDRVLEHTQVQRGALLGYHGYIALNVLVLLRLALG